MVIPGGHFNYDMHVNEKEHIEICDLSENQLAVAMILGPDI
jgi:hypothetical protein